jgi:uncharacterized membrane protein (UPF0136 family)
MQLLALVRLYFFIFGVLTIGGGLMGYIKVHSSASLIAGGISGVLLLVAGWLVPQQPSGGLILGLITSLLLAGYFIPKFMRTGAVMPAGLMSILSVVAIVLVVVAWVKK